MIRDRLGKTTAVSFCANFAVGAVHAAVGLSTHSWWFITLGVYYILLSVMRFAVLQITRRSNGDTATEQFARRFTGVMLVLLAVCLAGTVILAAVTDRGTKHHEIVMISIAVYTFTKVTLAVIHLVQARRYPSPAFKTLRSISFADALVSVFSLQRSMLVTFEGMRAQDVQLFNILTGSGVCIAVLLLGINLIGGRNVTMAKSRMVKTGEKIAEGVVDGYKKIEQGVVGGYKKIEKGVVDGYTKLEDKFVDQYLTRDGETVEEAKARLKKQNEGK